MVDWVGNPNIRQFRRRLRQIDGVVNIKQATPTGSNEGVIDFTMGFPFNPIVESPNRVGGIANSSVAMDREGNVDTFTLRYPPLPADVWIAGDVRALMRDIVPNDMLGPIEVQVNPGTGGEVEEWWPHLLMLHTQPMTLSETAELIEITLPEYLERARDMTQQIEEGHNG